MKKLLLSLMMVGAGIAVTAQTTPVKFGIKAGLTSAKMSTTSDMGDTDMRVNSSLYVGGTVEIPMGGLFSLQPGISLVGKGSKIDAFADNIQMNEGKFEGDYFYLEVKSTVLYIEVPVNALVSFPVGKGKIFLGAGPYYAMAISGKRKAKVTVITDEENTSESTEEDLKLGKDGDIKRGDFGVNLLGGYQLRSGFNFHAGYGLGLSNISQDAESKMKNRVLTVGLGFSF